ncbi:hypothetical protein NPIL_419311, partial [Nephila pilipes]
MDTCHQIRKARKKILIIVAVGHKLVRIAMQCGEIWRCVKQWLTHCEEGNGVDDERRKDTSVKPS